MCALLPLGGHPAWAQDPAPPRTSLAAFAAKRFPQPVRVGDLIHRDILRPLESRPILGYVKEVVRSSDGQVKIVVNYGGFLGFHTRDIAVPVEGMVLLGVELEIIDFTTEQLQAFPTYARSDATVLGPDEMISMGLAHPSH